MAKSNLPLDLIANILARLPLKHLFPLKTVSKSWLSLLTSSHFANLHTLCSHPTRHLILPDPTITHLFILDLDNPQLPATKLTLPPTLKPNKTTLGGPCDGIVPIYDKTQQSVFLLNPCTQQYKVVPNCGPDYLSSYGFGFDPVANDYKLVRSFSHSVSTAPKTISVYRVTEIYSVKNDKWKFVEGEGAFMPSGYYPSPSGPWGALVGTHLVHWILESGFSSLGDSPMIGCFDLSEEKLSLLPLPDHVDSGPLDRRQMINMGGSNFEPRFCRLRVLDGCLCLVTSNRLNASVFDVWVMKEYGVAESWVRLLDISDSCITQRDWHCPVAWSEDGREILVEKSLSSKLAWYDLGAKTSRAAQFNGIPDCQGDKWNFDRCGVAVFSQSLARIPGGLQIGDENQHGEPSTKGSNRVGAQRKKYLR